MLVLAAKIVISLGAIFIYWQISKNNSFWGSSTDRFLKGLTLGLIGSRFGLFFLFVLALNGSATSDVVVYYQEARDALSGKLPLIDIKTAYGPLFPYLAAIPTFIWNNAMVIIIASIFFEISAFVLWIKFASQNFSDVVTKRAALLYVCNPLTVCNVPISGQNHIWIAAALAGSILLLAKGRNFMSGIVLGASIVGVKFLSLMFAPPLALVAYAMRGMKASASWTISFILLPFLIYILFLQFGLNPFEQIQFHAFYNSSGNIPYLLTVFGSQMSDAGVRMTLNIFGFVTLCALFIFLALRGGVATIQRASLSCGFILMVILLVSGKSFTSYMLVALFPVCLSVAHDTDRSKYRPLIFLAWSTVAAIEPSLWFRLMSQSDLSSFQLVTFSPTTIFLIVELIVIFGYLLLLNSTYRNALSFRSADRGSHF